MLAVNGEAKPQWGMPNDRQLQLRAKLGVGWSTYKKDIGLSEEEQNKIKFVVQKAELLEQAEQERIGSLVEKYEHICRQAKGSGPKQCVLCGDDARGVVTGNRICTECKKAVCSKCSVEVSAKKKQQQQFQQQQQQVYLCKMCSEQRELWKKSGAWFFKSMPSYKVPERSTSLLSIHLLGSSRDTLARYGSGAAMAPVAASAVHPLQKTAAPTTASPSHHADGTTFGLHPGTDSRKLPSPASPRQPWSRVRADYSDDSPDSNDSSEDSPAHVKYRTYQLGADAAPLAHLASPLTSSSRQHMPQLTAARLAEASCHIANDPADITDAAPVDIVWHQQQQQQQRHNSLSSAGSAATTAGSAQLSATESFRDELLASRGGGCAVATEADEGLERVLASCAPVMQRRGSRRPRGVFDSNWSVQSEVSSEESAVMSAQPHTHEPSVAQSSSLSMHPAPLGMITFTLLYDVSQSKLEVHVFEGKHLPTTGAYVQLNLIPGHGKSRKLKTRTRHKTVDPYWNDMLVYHGLDVDEMRSKTLRLTVKDGDAPTAPNHRRTIGEYRLALSDLPVSQLQRYSVPLAPPQHCSLSETKRSGSHSSRGNGNAGNGKECLGKICIALRYSPSQAALHVTVVRCAALIAMDQNGYSDPYVKLYLKPDKSKKSKHKTAIRKKTLNPEFNEEFVYHMTRDELTAKSLQVSVWDYDKVAKNDFIGGVLLGGGSQASSDTAARHWQSVISAPNVRHEEWHKLQSIGKGSSDDE